jgi:transcriptional regulator with XRE-family HTH domain
MENCNSISYVGKILQERRVAQGLSVHQLAKKSGVSSGLISQIERGIANPSLNTINSLTTALGLQLGLLFEDQPEEEKSDIVIHRHQRRKLRVDDPNFVYELLTPGLDHTLEFVWVESAPGSSTEGSPFCHKGEECGLVLEGTLEVYLDGERHILKAGDSIIFDSNIPHWYHNPGPERVSSVWAITPPSF